MDKLDDTSTNTAATAIIKNGTRDFDFFPSSERMTPNINSSKTLSLNKKTVCVNKKKKISPMVSRAMVISRFFLDKKALMAIAMNNARNKPYMKYAAKFLPVVLVIKPSTRK
jgi:hypothetical protein